jgi:hypothetical protein
MPHVDDEEHDAGDGAHGGYGDQGVAPRGERDVGIDALVGFGRFGGGDAHALGFGAFSPFLQASLPVFGLLEQVFGTHHVRERERGGIEHELLPRRVIRGPARVEPRIGFEQHGRGRVHLHAQEIRVGVDLGDLVVDRARRDHGGEEISGDGNAARTGFGGEGQALGVVAGNPVMGGARDLFALVVYIEARCGDSMGVLSVFHCFLLSEP